MAELNGYAKPFYVVLSIIVSMIGALAMDNLLTIRRIEAIQQQRTGYIARVDSLEERMKAMERSDQERRERLVMLSEQISGAWKSIERQEQGQKRVLELLEESQRQRAQNGIRP